MKIHKHIILFLSVFSIVLLTIAFIYLSSIRPLEQNQTAHNFVTELLSKDPKVQRDAAKGQLNVNIDQTATDILFYLNQYSYYPLTAIAFSVILNVIVLILLNRDKDLSGGLLICSAVASFFTIIPPILQVISYFLIKKDNFNAIVN